MADEKLVVAVQELLRDIEDMRCIPDDTYYNDNGYWVGPFSEFDNQLETVNIEWPNLLISAQKVTRILDERQLKLPLETTKTDSSQKGAQV